MDRPAYILPAAPTRSSSFFNARPRVSVKVARPRLRQPSTRHQAPAAVASPPPQLQPSTGTNNPLQPPDVTVIEADAEAVVQLAEFSGAGGDDAGLPLSYDESVVENYWKARPGAALKRLTEVTLAFTPWVARVALDTQRGVLGENSGKRAAELREILSSLGPTFVKLGQALSVRPDLVGPNAMAELRALCDAVPSFPNEVAFAMMEEELGRPVDEVYSTISKRPVAAASLGQVYKAELRETGEQVAVKVQRPDMLRKVSLDLYCLKRVARFADSVQRSFTASQTDYLSLLDQWARGTYKELDYENEAENSRKFASLVQARLPDVYVPRVFDQYTSRKVLTMEWIDGVKLADCESEQINALVNKGVECFLFQLLSGKFARSFYSLKMKMYDTPTV